MKNTLVEKEVTMLVAHQLSKSYQLHRRSKWYLPSTLSYIDAVKDLDITIHPGKIIGLLGINGAGKTTTLRMLSTILEPTSGSLHIDEINALAKPNEAKKIINLITGGERSLYWRLTAKENLEYFGALYNISGQALYQRIKELLMLVGLQDKADIPVERYSKGMKQRLQIARGLINDPRYLFLDEPTLGLDIVFAREIRTYIRGLTKQNKGILLTTHYLSEVEELCDYVYILDKGTIILQGSISELKLMANLGYKTVITVNLIHNDQKEEIIKRFSPIADISFDYFQGLCVIEINSKQDITPTLTQHLFENNIPVVQIKLEEPKLEDALLRLAGKE